MTIDIIEVGKIVSALVCITGIPLGLYKAFKNWANKLFSKIESIEDSVNNLKTEVENMKIENDRRFSELNNNINDVKGTSRTFYSIINTVIDVMYKHHPDNELDNAKKAVTNELIAKATEVHHE